MTSNPQESNTTLSLHEGTADHRASANQRLGASSTTSATPSEASSVLMMEKDIEKAASASGADLGPKSSTDDEQKVTVTTSHDVPAETSPPAAAAVNPMDPSQFPDGGVKAWTVVFASGCGLVVSFGWINCIGVFQAYYEAHQLRNYTSQEVAWIPSLEAFMMFSGGLWVGRVYDNYGPRILVLTGTFFHVFGLMMASISTKYYQILLSQGVCSALGASMIFYPSMSAVVTWFLRRRALALGVAATGSSIGGVIFPIMVEKLIPQVGFGWTMRICAFLILALMVVANLLLVSRIPPRPQPVRPKDFIVPFMEKEFALLAFGSFLMFLGVYLPFTFVILTARARGVPQSISIYLVSILNAASTFGRTIPTFYADRIGRFAMMLVTSFLTFIIVLALWLPSSGTAATIVFCVIFGFGSGAALSLLPACIAQISPIHQIGVRTGALFFVVAVAVLIGSPIGGQLVRNDGFRSMQGFSGALMAGGWVVWAFLWVHLGGLKGKIV